MGYFPRTTEPYQRRYRDRDQDWAHSGPHAFRKLAFSLLDMALVTGLVLRLGRAALLGYVGESDGQLFATAILLGLVFLFGMTALHLGNFPLRHWVFRAPAFGLAVGAVEAATSLVLIAAGREPYGSSQATFVDWLNMAVAIVPWRLALVVAFAAVLALIVQSLRVATLRRREQL